MLQQINLNKYLTQPIRSSITSKTLIFSYIFFIGFLFIMSGIHKMHQHDLEKTLLEDQAQATLAEAQLAIVTAKYVTLSSDKNAICRTKFSSFLSVLSEDIVGGAWLTDIRITDSGKNMIFKGIAISSASVQRFVNNLKLNPLFSKNTINLQDMSQLSDNKAGTLQFTIVGATPHE